MQADDFGYLALRRERSRLKWVFTGCIRHTTNSDMSAGVGVAHIGVPVKVLRVGGGDLLPASGGGREGLCPAG